MSFIGREIVAVKLFVAITRCVGTNLTLTLCRREIDGAHGM